MNIIIIASALGAVSILSSCSGGGDNAAQIIVDEFVSISGKTSSLGDPSIASWY